MQLARALGADVHATASAHNAELVRRLGATPIDYRAQTVEQYVASLTDGEGFDLVVDTVGGASLDASFAAVRDFGHVVSALGWGTHALAPLSLREASYSGIFTLYPLLTGRYRAHLGEMMREATRLVGSGALAPVVDQTRFDLRSAAEAYQLVASGTGRVKVVVEVDTAQR
ncbi:NADPH:quinone reductase-like Zn-dependent oxidoreductase [Paraburkholderia sp. UCT70]